MKWKIGILVVVVGAFVVYNFPYFKEMRAFNKVEDGKILELCNWYLDEYPSGRHVDDVLYMKIGLSKYDMATIVDYLTKCPDGIHATEVNELCDKLWDEEILKYNQRDKTNELLAAVKYMSEMLQYMKKHRVNTIIVDINSTLNLKDYNEYDQGIRDILEITTKRQMSLAAGMISLKSNFTASDNSSLMKILTEGVQRSIDKMFTPGFINILAEDEKNANKMPQLNFDYIITSQEDKYGEVVAPHIWVYTDENGKTLNYLVGISISFKAHFSIPDSSITFDYLEKGEPADNINNVKNIEDGYRQMTYICFAQFSNKMSKNMGLAETYFQGNVDDKK